MKQMIATGICLVLFFAVLAGGAQARDLRLPNADFEKGLESWKEIGVDVKTEISAEAAYRGRNGALVSDDNVDAGSSLQSELIEVRPGDDLKLTFVARLISGDGMGVYLRFFDRDRKEMEFKDDQGGEILYSTKVRSTKWEKHTYEAEVPEGAAFVAVWLHSYVSDQVVAHLDEFELEK